ncbi:S1-C subfamily serine protease [Anaerotaenia torta]|uniref:S1C family serine protease n=1 Tax=Anaerotaenia torta TaxID=433293 RepID=UPI003D2594D9
MSGSDKKDFEFIKEQVIEKKRKKLRKKIMPIIMTVCLAVVFGVIAAITFVLTEPGLYGLLHKEEETKTPADFPTLNPDDHGIQANAQTGEPGEKQSESKDGEEQGEKGEETKNFVTDAPKDTQPEPETVIIERPIDADVDDYTSIFNGLRKISSEVEKSIVTVVGITDETDVWFGTSVELAKETYGLIIHNNNVDLLILTSLERIEDADIIQVRFSDNFTVDATLQDYETELNLAVIAVPLEKIPPIYMSGLMVAKLGESYTLTVGSPILALGSPNGYTGSMETGIVSSRNSHAYITDNKLDLFNTDITDNENSEGVIVNMKGEVVGLITRTLKGEMDAGLSTAIGISKLKTFLTNMSNRRARVYFGVKTIDMPDAVKKEFEITAGIYVNEVREASPAFLAGIQSGDIIFQVDGQTITHTNNFYSVISSLLPGEEVSVKIQRTTGAGQKELEVKVTLAEKQR